MASKSMHCPQFLASRQHRHCRVFNSLRHHRSSLLLTRGNVTGCDIPSNLSHAPVPGRDSMGANSRPLLYLSWFLVSPRMSRQNSAECDVWIFQIIAEACAVGAILDGILATKANAKILPVRQHTIVCHELGEGICRCWVVWCWHGHGWTKYKL